MPFDVPDGGWDCFVAHADADSPVAERLAELLRARQPAVRVFEDSMLPAGLPWNVLDQRLEASAVIVVLGGIIPNQDIEGMKKIGVAAIFQPGTAMDDIVQFIRTHVKGPGVPAAG